MLEINYVKVLIIFILACPDDCGDCDSLLHCITCKISSHILNEQGHCDCPYGYEKDVNE